MRYYERRGNSHKVIAKIDFADGTVKYLDEDAKTDEYAQEVIKKMEEDMKYLNKNSPNSPLNKKLREIYKVKQEINNSKLEKNFKDRLMKSCDNEIHMCWELSYRGVKGYEIY